MEDKGITRRRFMTTTAKTALALGAAGTMLRLVPAYGQTGEPVREGPIEADLDLIIRNGTIFDGTAAPSYVADIGIRGDRIFSIGKITGRAPVVIDAAGLAVTPGFIDVHTHCDLTFQLSGARRLMAYLMPSWKGNYNYLYQGVTTVVTGNCGWGYGDADYWYSLADSVGFGANVCHLAPHGVIREILFGMNQRPELSRKEMDTLKGRIADEMRKGAVGFSTGLAYAPGLLCSKEEIIRIARVVRNHRGVYATHIRDEGGISSSKGGIGVLEAIREAIDIGRRAEISVEISHLKIQAPMGGVKAEQVLELIEKGRAEGIPIHADQYPYDAGSTTITILLPNEFIVSSGIKEKYRVKEGRRAVKAAIEEVFAYLPPEKTLITMDNNHPSREGKTIREIAEREGKSAADAYVEMVCQDTPPFGVFFNQDLDVVRQLMPRDYIITASDGWTVPKDMGNPHPRTYGTFPRKLRQFVFSEKRLDFRRAIMSMTSLPAEKFGIAGRGKIAEGNYADIAVIDPNTIADRATYRKPHQYAEGVSYLLVNGVPAIEKGKATGERGGRALKKG